MDAARHAHDFVLSSIGISVLRHLYPSVHCPSAYLLYVPGASCLFAPTRPLVRSRLFAPLPPLVCCFGAFTLLSQRFLLCALEKCFRRRRI
jgi:hypothetical protein